MGGKDLEGPKKRTVWSLLFNISMFTPNVFASRRDLSTAGFFFDARQKRAFGRGLTIYCNGSSWGAADWCSSDGGWDLKVWVGGRQKKKASTSKVRPTGY